MKDILESRDTSRLETHTAADLLPMMSEPELAALVEDIRENGQRESIKLLDGAVIDGRNRLRACELAGVQPAFDELDPQLDPVAYVISENVVRRNLGRSQRAMVAAEAWAMYEVGQGRRTDLTSPQDRGEVRTVDRLAPVFGVGQTAIEHARALIARAPQAAEAVKAGRATLDGAYEALRAAERAQRAAADEERQLAEDLQGIRSRLATLTKATVELDLLPPPDPDELAQRIDRTSTVTVPPQTPTGDIERLSEDKSRLQAWDAAIHVAHRLSRQVRSLPGFPQDDEGGQLHVAAFHAARVLGDAAARILANVPEPSNPPSARPVSR